MQRKKQFGRKESKMNSSELICHQRKKSRKATRNCVKNPQNVWKNIFPFLTIEFATTEEARDEQNEVMDTFICFHASSIVSLEVRQ